MLQLIFCWLLFAFSAQAVENGTITSIESRLYYQTSDTQMSLEALRQSNPDWILPRGASPSFGFTDDTVWAKVELYNPSSNEEDLYLQIRWPLFTKVNAFVVSDKGTDRIPSLEYRFPVYPISMAPNERKTIYIEAASNALFLMPITLINANYFFQDALPELVIMYGAFGLFVAVILYNGFLGLGTRETVYRYYVLYFLSAFVWISFITGVIYQWGYSRSGLVGTYGFAMSICCAQAFGGLFCIKFLNLEKDFYTLYRIIKYCCYGWFVLLALCFWLPIYVLRFLGVPLSLMLCSAALFAGIYLWRQGHAHGKYFTIAWSLLIITVLDYSLTWVGFAYNEFRHTWLLVLAASAEAILLSLGLAERFNEQKREKNRLQEELINHQKEANIKLEEKVKDRTESLRLALSDLEKANTELAYLTETDQLTGVKNRRYFDTVFVEEINRSLRDQLPVSLIILDIDHFKRFNDDHGHLVGDDCLRHVAQTVNQEISRSGDVFARYGGEEFAVVLHNTDEQGCVAVAERIRDAIEKSSFASNGNVIPVTASLGCVSIIATENIQPIDVIEMADEALYKAKDAGRNCVKSAA